MINDSIENAEGDVIFILHSNDRIIKNDCLEKINRLFILSARFNIWRYNNRKPISKKI